MNICRLLLMSGRPRDAGGMTRVLATVLDLLMWHWRQSRLCGVLAVLRFMLVSILMGIDVI